MSQQTSVAVFLCGEGRNELGSLASEAPYQSKAEPGVIVALLKRVATIQWHIGGANTWKSVRKYRAHGRSNDEHVVFGIAADALDHDCDVAAFIRDQDYETDRQQAIENAKHVISTDPQRPVAIIGGVAVPMLEGWILALGGKHQTEQLGRERLKEEMLALGLRPKHTQDMVAMVEQANMAKLPPDAHSLRQWLDEAKEHLAP